MQSVGAQPLELPAELTASSLDTSGTIRFTGQMSGLTLEGQGPMGAPILFEGASAGGQAQVFYQELLQAPGGATGVETDSGTAQEPVPPGGIGIRSRTGVVAAHLYNTASFTANGTTTQQGPLRIALPASDTIEFPDYLGQDEPIGQLDVRQTIALQGFLGRAAIHGDLDALLWGANLTHSEGTTWSGSSASPAAETGSPLDDSFEQERRQAVRAGLRGLDATLAPPPKMDATWFADALTLHIAGEVQIASPVISANSQDAARILGDALLLQGESTLILQRSDLGIGIQIVSAESAFLDGEEVMIQGVTVSPGATVSPWLWIPPVLVVLGVASLVFARSSPTARLRALEKHLEDQEYTWVATHAAPALRSRRTARRAALYKATSLLALKQFQEARLFLADLPHGKRPDPATHHFLTAHAAAGIGQTEVARRELAESLAIEPSYQADAEAIPELRRILHPDPRPKGPGRGEAYA